METILDPGYVGQYRSGYEGYGELLRVVGETKHQSCLIFTSREKPGDLAAFEGVRSLQLADLTEAAVGLCFLLPCGLNDQSLTEHDITNFYPITKPKCIIS
ncbi:MAG: hypothetical protein KME21_13945 [Desmonostoc vinosum HA7617-LM4]|jgi:hypothetical protein|nr:hypothetical protein [Desmonostoc vinosum HA7617-LM4]